MHPLQVGVCNWSLAIPDLEQCFDTIANRLHLKVIHLGFWDQSFNDRDRIRSLLDKYELEVSATCLGFEGEDYGSIRKIAETGGYKPDAAWDQRFAKTRAYAEFTRDLGVDLLSTHIGFVPHDKSDPQYAVMVDRLKQVCEALADKDLTLVMETGQERADALREFIETVGYDNIRVNFDPANMILYGVGDPVEAVSILSDMIVHCHMKDATPSDKPTEEWGAEVPLGTGEADIPRVVSKLRATGYRGPLIIEREAGDNRVGDVQDGADLLHSLVG